MFNKDYIMRMIELLVQGIDKIMRLKQEKRYEECGEVLTDTLRQFYGLNDRSVEELPWADLMAVASLGPVPDAEKCALLAQLLREKADLEELRGRADVTASLMIKSLCIYISAILADDDFNTQTHLETVDAIAEAAGKYTLPADAEDLLFRYYDLTGRFAKAEDALYRLLERGECRADAAERGRAFYGRLLLKTDEELKAGNLPRDEVVEGLLKL